MKLVMNSGRELDSKMAVDGVKAGWSKLVDYTKKHTPVVTENLSKAGSAMKAGSVKAAGYAKKAVPTGQYIPVVVANQVKKVASYVDAHVKA
jgi:hypothetical protein